MNRVLKLNLLLILLCGATTGCATLQSVPSKMKTMVLRTETTDDPLVTGAKVSPGYKAAKRELKNADVTMLKFAEWCEQRGDFLEAKQRYLDILNDDSDSVEARLGVARVEFATGRKDEAQTILEATSKKHPENAQVWVQMGRIQTAREQWGAASQSLLKATTLAPDDQETRYQLGLALARSERYDEALEHLKFSVGESAALYNIGFVLSEAGRTEEAEHWLKRALQSHPNERTRTMANHMLAELRVEDDPSAGPRIIAGPPPKSRVDIEQTSYQAYRETPKNWKTPRKSSGHSDSTSSPGTNNTPIQGANHDGKAVTQASFSRLEPTNQSSGVNINAATPPWRGGGQPKAGMPRNLKPSPNSAVEPPLWRQ